MKPYAGLSSGASSRRRSIHILPRHRPRHRHQHLQEELWESLLLDPSQWWDNRMNKTRPQQPDFTHMASREPLWLDQELTPSWVRPRLLPRLDDSFGKIRLAAAGREIQSLCQEGDIGSAFESLSRVHAEGGFFPSEFVYLSLLKLCNACKRPDYAGLLHAHLARHGLHMASFVGEYLAVTLAKCGSLDDALILFDRLPHRNVFSWTAMMSSLTDHKKGHLALQMYVDMVERGVEPDKFTFATLAKACASTSNLGLGRRIHGDARESGFAEDVFVGSALIGMYSKCGCIGEAELAFLDISPRNIVSWNAMLSAYVEHGLVEKAFRLFRQIRAECVELDLRTFVISLQACCVLAKSEDSGCTDMRSCSKVAIALEIGRALHSDLRKKGSVFDIYVNNVLLSMYAKCGTIVEAEHVFCGMDGSQNNVSWNEMALAYIEQGYVTRALQLYKVMQQRDINPDRWSFVIFLRACCLLEDTEKSRTIHKSGIPSVALMVGRALHEDAKRKHLACHLFVGNSLVKMYGKCGSTADAESVFDELRQRDTVSWNVMLSAYVEKSGQQEKALLLFRKMLEAGPLPDDITLVYMLRACSGTAGSAHLCRLIHLMIFCIGCDDNKPLLANTLVHAYGGCSSMLDAQAVFDRLTTKDVASWNSLIAGYAQDGDLNACLECFERMQAAAGIKPDAVTFLSMFFAFSHSGSVDKGIQFFGSMSKFGIAPEVKHFGGIMDSLARAGDLGYLESILSKVPMQPDATLWSSLLGACQTHNNKPFAEHAFDHVFDHDPGEAPSYVLMSNIYARAEAKTDV